VSTALVTGLNGLSYAFILFLLAAGFSLTFGVMGVLNLSHGALFMFGAYIGLQVVSQLHNFWVAIAIAAIALAVIGFGLYFFFLRHLYNKVPEQAVLTIGLSYMIANVVLWIWGPVNHMGQEPGVLAGVFKVGTLSFPIYRLFIISRFSGGCRIGPGWERSFGRAWTTRT
jgi:branched-chain amino acid transport system permease protein